MSGDDFLAIHLCNQGLEQGKSDPMMPLVRYLASEKPITSDMRKWLADMLAENGSSIFRLVHKQRAKGTRPGRKKAETFVYLRAGWLKNRVITPDFIASLMDSTGWKLAEPDPGPTKTYRLGEEELDQYGHPYVKHRVTLNLGQRLTSRQIEEIISAETYWQFGREDWASLRTVQRYLQGWQQDE
ncbi:hypothetical protein [Bradyrhizobium sp. 6(2017)]|uniref:hypothetical protein n=1 Tax=Bradyrhizobium sp. 6(2017) TaxID=1197460 RepID=UPI0013E17806|nr:hypothetical protein [Bradyrhizobium sp. 6(2017)]QIG92438.1 hypothetical protein G6P99_07915 [Bradyrhizobium sp. 6(2017)]